MGVDRIWRLAGFVRKGRRRGGSGFPARALGWPMVPVDGMHPCIAYPRQQDMGGCGYWRQCPSSRQPHEAGVWDQLAAAQLFSTVSVPVNRYAWTEGTQPHPDSYGTYVYPYP